MQDRDDSASQKDDRNRDVREAGAKCVLHRCERNQLFGSHTGTAIVISDGSPGAAFANPGA